MAETRLPVNILTGFLGSGKTTVLRHVLRDPDFADTAVLINEFGEIGLDHLLVGALDEAPVLLSSGCVCCSIRGDLARALADLHARRARGEVPPFRRVIVETTGLADPTPILATLTGDRVLRHHFRAGGIVATVDAVLGAAGLDAFPEMLRQVAIADRLIVTKPDLADPRQAAALSERLRGINPAAAVTVALHGAVPAALFRQDIADPETRMAEAAAWAAAPARHREGGIHAIGLTRTEPLDWSAFALWLSLLTHRHGTRLLRLKGVLDIAGSATPVAVHAVQHVVHAPEHLPAWPGRDRRSRLVLIVQELDEMALRRSFGAFMALATEAVA